MRIVVFGAAGRTGRHLVEEALRRGLDVTAFVRDRSGMGPHESRLEVVAGDARDVDTVTRAVTDRDALISVLSLASADRELEHSKATRVVLDAAREAGVRRVVLTGNNDVFTDRELTGDFAAMGREHRRNRATAEASGLDWTIGAAPWVTDDPPSGTYVAMLDAKAPGKRLPAADFATFVLDALERDEWIGHVVGVSAPVQDGSPR